MTDLLELLANANPVRTDELAPSIDVLRSRLEHAARQTRVRRREPGSAIARARRWRTPTASLAVVGAIAVLIVELGGGGPSTAFAGWSAAPTPAMSTQLQAAESACSQRTAQLASLTPTVADTRGPTAMLVYADSGLVSRTGRPMATACLTGVAAFGTLLASGDGAVNFTPDPDEIVPHVQEQAVAADGQGYTFLDGQIGPAVTAVALVLDDGSTVEATTANGWFAAWWPTNQGVQSANVSTPSGTTSQPINGYSGPAAPR